jgi:type IV pilus assembly protein PilM
MSILQSLLGREPPELIGLDISSSAVKLVELSRRGGKYHVEAFSVEPLPANAVNDKQIADPKLVAESIARAVARSGTRTRQVALGVAGASVITKLIQLPSNLTDFDMEEQIKAQADQYVPYPIEDVNLDFQVQGATEGGSGMSDVILAACRKEQVEQRCAAAEMAGLIPKVVDVEAYAAENACMLLAHQMPALGVKKTVAVVDVGANTTSLLVLHDLKTVYTRDQSFGGKLLTEEIMRQYSLSFEEAGKAKKTADLPESYEQELLPAFIADMGQQIDRSLQFFFAASSKHSSVDQVILAGGCAHIPGVAEKIQERLRVPTVLARPFAEMGISARAKPSVLARDEASMLIACGLALRAFDEPRR